MQVMLDMIRYVAVFYLLEQMALHVLPGKAYEKYVRFYMGILLVLLLLQPLCAVFRTAGQTDLEALLREWEQEDGEGVYEGRLEEIQR